jgi:uncharacterized protein (DUF2461 family)
VSKPGNGFTRRSFELFEELAANNNKQWFHANRDAFNEYVTDPFAQFLESVSERLADGPLPCVGWRS